VTRLTLILSALLVALVGILAGLVMGLLYARCGRPGAVQTIVVPAPTPVQFGYSVGPGWQKTPTPGTMGDAQAELDRLSGPVATPTSVWLQPERDVPCDMADAIARDAATHSCEALWAAERDDAHVQRGIQTEPGVQVSRIHEYGRFTYMLFSQALIIWRNTGDDGRIGVFSPHGCWHGLPESLQPPTS
jgi:hypothetical protein